VSGWLGLDIGTSSVKGLLVTETGDVLARGHAAYPTRRLPGDRAEQNPEDWVRAVASVVAQCATGTRPDGVALVGHTPSLVLADSRRRAVLPCLSWQDARAREEARELEHACGDADTLLGTGLPWGPSYLPAKLLWVARHEEHALSGAKYVLQPKDHLGYVLTGVAATDAWSSKGLCRVDPDTAAAEAVFAAAGADSSLLPERREPWSLLGTVDRFGATMSGLDEGVPVAVGWSDALAGMTAVGAFEEPSAFLLTGTSQIAGLTGGLARRPCDLLTVPVSRAPLPVCYGPTQAGGAAIAWAERVLGRGADELTELAMTADAASVPRFLPYLDGERAPVWRPDVRGGLQDLSSDTGPAEIARAVMRGVSLSTRHVLSTAAEATGVPIGHVHLGGRNAAALEWTAVRLETLGMPIVAHREPESTGLGAAMLAAAAATGRDLPHWSRRMGGRGPVRTPDAEQVAFADELYQAYLRDVETELAARETTHRP
jgi:xylulokinase